MSSRSHSGDNPLPSKLSQTSQQPKTALSEIFNSKFSKMPWKASEKTSESKSSVFQRPWFPCKQEWLNSWFHKGELCSLAPATGGKYLAHRITISISCKGFGLVFSDRGGKPIVAATGESKAQHPDARMHEFMGVRRGLYYVLDYKRKYEAVAAQLEVRCTSSESQEVLDYVVDSAHRKVTLNCELCTRRIEYLFGLAEDMCLSELWKHLILDIFDLFVKLHGCDIDITCGIGGIEAARFMADRQTDILYYDGVYPKSNADIKCRIGNPKIRSVDCRTNIVYYTPQIEGSSMRLDSRFLYFDGDYAVEELKPDAFPEELKEILYQIAYNFHLPYSFCVPT